MITCDPPTDLHGWPTNCQRDTPHLYYHGAFCVWKIIAAQTAKLTLNFSRTESYH
jgi:hypothetical protein